MNEELKRFFEQVYDQWGQGTVQAILKEIDRYPIKWRGTLRRSISYQIGDVAGEDAISFNMADYGEFVDKGVNGIFQNRGSKYNFRISSIGGVAYHVKPWADSKGLNNWAVARSIVRKGFKPRPFFDSVIQARFPKLQEDLTQAYQSYLDSQVESINRSN
jgi:hypothetical protein